MDVTTNCMFVLEHHGQRPSTVMLSSWSRLQVVAGLGVRSCHDSHYAPSIKAFCTVSCPGHCTMTSSKIGPVTHISSYHQGTMRTTRLSRQRYMTQGCWAGWKWVGRVPFWFWSTIVTSLDLMRFDGNAACESLITWFLKFSSPVGSALEFFLHHPWSLSVLHVWTWHRSPLPLSWNARPGRVKEGTRAVRFCFISRNFYPFHHIGCSNWGQRGDQKETIQGWARVPTVSRVVSFFASNQLPVTFIHRHEMRCGLA